MYRKKVKLRKMNVLKSEAEKRMTKISVCIVEDHCDVSLFFSVGCNIITRN